MIFKEDDTIVLAIRTDDMIEKDPINYQDIDLTLFWVVRSSKGGE